MWTCPKCATRVDDHFDACWSCGTDAQGVEDPAFLTADEAGPIDDPVPDALADDPFDDFAGSSLPELVDCYRAGDTIEAKFIADRLNEAGIPAVSDRINMNMSLGGLKPDMWGYGPKVRVRPKDLPAALAWIEDYEQRRKSR